MKVQKENEDSRSNATSGKIVATAIRSPLMKRDHNIAIAQLPSSTSSSNFKNNKPRQTESSIVQKTKKSQLVTKNIETDIETSTNHHDQINNKKDDVMEEGPGATVKPFIDDVKVRGQSSPSFSTMNTSQHASSSNFPSPNDKHNNNSKESSTKGGLIKRQSDLREFIQEQREKNIERNNSESDEKKSHEEDDDDKTNLFENELSKYALPSAGESGYDNDNYDQSTNQSQRDSKKNSPPKLTNDNKTLVQADHQEDTTSRSPQLQQPIRTALPVLHIGNFQESLFLDYGNDTHNIEGKSRSLSFVLQAPPSKSKSSSTYDDNYHILHIEKVPEKKGFTLTRSGESDCEGTTAATDKATLTPNNKSLKDPFYIKAGEQQVMTLTWAPTSPGRMRETIYLKMQRGRIRIIAHGAAKKRPIRKKVKIVSFGLISLILSFGYSVVVLCSYCFFTSLLLCSKSRLFLLLDDYQKRLERQFDGFSSASAPAQTNETYEFKSKNFNESQCWSNKM